MNRRCINCNYGNVHIMDLDIVEKVGDVKIYGNGELGGKSAGLVKINECPIPKSHKLSTRILTTYFYDRYLSQERQFSKKELNVLSSILTKLKDIPISVRSSATNEACVSSENEDSVHAGENTSFMLPNNHPDFSTRLHQLKQAIYHIYNDFINKQPSESKERMAIVINPIPGKSYETQAGPVYFPLISGVANSYFPYALKTQDPKEGFARVALGHGYATVFDDFPVISLATIQNPIPQKLLGDGQNYFYAIDMLKNEDLQGDELETMRRLHIRFANQQEIKQLGSHKTSVTLESLISDDLYGFRGGLQEIMKTITSRISSHFQIEFIFNIESKENSGQTGNFHVVQLTQLPELQFDQIAIPDSIKTTYLSIENFQGHGMKQDIKYAVVVTPFIYAKEMYKKVREKLSDINERIGNLNENYILIVPGRLGSKNRDWGIFVNYCDLNRASAIFEYGVDISGHPEPLSEDDNLTGGIYGSHFLYMLQGGHDEQQKRIQTRMYGTQGTHFLTNLMSNNVIYGYIAPGVDTLDPWFFTPPEANEAIYVLTFPRPASVCADFINHQCMIYSED